MGPIAWRRLTLTVVVLDTVVRYWLTVYPLVRWHTRRWRRRAAAIPDPMLRQIALNTHRAEGGNLEGAAAFAAFAPLRRRAAVVRASVAFQTIYDYVDSLAEQPSTTPFSNGSALHEALHVALCPSSPHGAYYRHHRRTDDGGYLRRLVDACRGAMRELPSHGVIEPHLADATERMIAYQAHVHSHGPGTRGFAAWARAHTPPESGLLWWEAAAAAASSLGAFALVAAAADPRLSVEEADAIDRAYFPWAGALHVLLDSLVDQPADASSGHCSLVALYARPEEAAARLGAIATAAFASARTLRQGTRHAAILAAMSAHYLSAPTAQLPHAVLARERVLAAGGGLTGSALAMMRGRRRLSGAARVSAPGAGTTAPAARCASR
jgi:tetraprenyl-beta-curcumene synthase